MKTKPLTKAQDIHDQLIDMATALGPKAKLPTVQQLRRELNVSITTLDGVLKQLENQSVIYRKHGHGIYVSPRLNRKCVGLVCDPAFFSAGTSPFWQQLIEGARSRAAQNGDAFRFYLAMRSSDNTLPVHDDLQDDVAANRIQGVLFLGNNLAAQDWLKQHDVASVVFAGQGEYRVEIDIMQLIDLAASHLVRQGCRRLALLCPCEVRAQPAENQDAEPGEWPDVSALRTFLKKAKLPLFPELLWEPQSLGNRVHRLPETHQEQGYLGTIHLFGGPHPAPDGVISTDDMMTRGILAALRKLGLRPGHDVEIVSHINRGSTVLNGEDENIAFVEVDPAEIVATMFSQLEKLMDNQIPAEPCALVPAKYRN